MNHGVLGQLTLTDKELMPVSNSNLESLYTASSATIVIRAISVVHTIRFHEVNAQAQVNSRELEMTTVWERTWNE